MSWRAPGCRAAGLAAASRGDRPENGRSRDRASDLVPESAVLEGVAKLRPGFAAPDFEPGFRARAVELGAPARFGCARPFGRPPASTTATRSACPSGVRRARTAPMTESCRTPSRIWGVVRPGALGSTGRTTPACGPGGRHFFVVAGPWSTQLRPSQSSYYSRLVTLLRGRLLATVTGSGSSGRDQIDRLSPQPH